MAIRRTRSATAIAYASAGGISRSWAAANGSLGCRPTTRSNPIGTSASASPKSIRIVSPIADRRTVRDPMDSVEAARSESANGKAPTATVRPPPRIERSISVSIRAAAPGLAVATTRPDIATPRPPRSNNAPPSSYAARRSKASPRSSVRPRSPDAASGAVMRASRRTAG